MGFYVKMFIFRNNQNARVQLRSFFNRFLRANLPMTDELFPRDNFGDTQIIAPD